MPPLADPQAKKYKNKQAVTCVASILKSPTGVNERGAIVNLL
jgi:hypothetical protein